MKYEFLNKVLYFPEKGALVIADVHVGYEEYLNEGGVFLPRLQFKETMKELKEIFKEIRKRKEKVEKIIILGDLKHEFGKISQQEWKETGELLDFLGKKAKELVLVKGNHDTILEPIAKTKKLEIKDFHKEGGVCFIHGDKLFPECLDKKTKMLILGHRHPAVVLFDKYKKEKYKCFLRGKWKRKEVVIMPSFFPFIEGGDVVRSYLGNNLFISERILKNFEVFIVSGEKGKVYRFGKLKSLI